VITAFLRAVGKRSFCARLFFRYPSRLVLILFMSLSGVSCSSTENELIDNATLESKVEDLVRFGNGEETAFEFTKANIYKFLISEFTDSQGVSYLGACWEEDGDINFKFNIQIKSSIPLREIVYWSIVTQDGFVYQESDFIDSAQPNAISDLQLEDFPSLDCSRFKPSVLILRMEDSSYSYQYIYRITINKIRWSDIYEVPEGRDRSEFGWIIYQYKLAEEFPYQVGGRKPFLGS
jgi:hypothetical protein